MPIQSPIAAIDSVVAPILTRVTSGDTAGRVPGVVAAVTDRESTVFDGAAGVRSLSGDTAMTTDTVFALFSTTKAITGTTVLQCVEEGLVDLEAPASEYVPELADIKVIDGFDAAGEPVLRNPVRPITTRHLMLHTAGFAYPFFDETYFRLAEQGLPSPITGTRASLHSPLLFDPGESWNYGTNMDWAGVVVERVRGARLGEVMAQRVFAPLGMTDTGFTMNDSMAARRASIHQRGEDGSLTPLDDLVLEQDPEQHMGGHGLYSTMSDYAKFLRMWLNDGDGPGGRVLRPDTVQNAAKDGLGGRKITPLRDVDPTLTNNAEFFPGQPKSWSYSFMVNDETAPTGRPAGSLGWAGLANLYYWIDRENGVAGIWGTQILPFADAVSFTGYLDMETAVYSALGAGER